MCDGEVSLQGYCHVHVLISGSRTSACERAISWLFAIPKLITLSPQRQWGEEQLAVVGVPAIGRIKLAGIDGILKTVDTLH